jgi:hypothetical protein
VDDANKRYAELIAKRCNSNRTTTLCKTLRLTVGTEQENKKIN